MTAYFIVHRRQITDPRRLKQFRDCIVASIAKFGGRVVVRAERARPPDDSAPAQRHNDPRREPVTVIAFPDMDSLGRWCDSADCAALNATRKTDAMPAVLTAEGSPAR